MSPRLRVLLAAVGGIVLLAGIVFSPRIILAQANDSAEGAGSARADAHPLALEPVQVFRLDSPDSPDDIPRGRLSSCQCQVTSTLKTDTVRMCDPIEVEVEVQPSCPVCQNLDVIFIQQDSPHWQWERDESLKILNEITRWASGGDRKSGEREVRIGVIQYNGTTVRTVVRMTKNNIGAARGKLSRPGTGHDPNGLFEEAGRHQDVAAGSQIS